MGLDTIFEDSEGDGDQDWCPDDPWTARNDADIDYGREVRRHGEA